jgi:DeoR family fructose operon transcriptional repressor
MKPENRQFEILKYLKRCKTASVSNLASHFHVSEMTIRRALSALENASLIVRTYGMAILADTDEDLDVFPQRVNVNLTPKQKIAQLAFPLLKNISSIYVDCSTTAQEFLKILPPDQSFTIFTNSLAALNLLCAKPNIKVFALGGFLYENNNMYDDIITEKIASQIFVDMTIFSCVGFSHEGPFNNEYPGTQFKRIMLNNSSETMLIADHTKALRKSIFLLSDWDSVTYFVTNEPLDPALRNTILQHNVTVLDTQENFTSAISL